MPSANVGLKEYMDERFTSVKESIVHLEKILDDKFEALNQIRLKSDEVLNERLSHMNQFREQTIEDRTSFTTRELCDSRMKPLEVKASFLNGRDAALVGVFGVLVVVAEFVMRTFWK